jgi:hypothetical protein
MICLFHFLACNIGNSTLIGIRSDRRDGKPNNRRDRPRIRRCHDSCCRRSFDYQWLRSSLSIARKKLIYQKGDCSNYGMGDKAQGEGGQGQEGAHWVLCSKPRHARLRMICRRPSSRILVELYNFFIKGPKGLRSTLGRHESARPLALVGARQFLILKETLLP